MSGMRLRAVSAPQRRRGPATLAACAAAVLLIGAPGAAPGGAAPSTPAVIPGPVTCCVWTPHWSPDGRRIAVAVARNPHRSQGTSVPLLKVATIPSGGGKARLIKGFVGYIERLDWSPDGRLFVFAHEKPSYDEDTGYIYYPAVPETADIIVQRADGRAAYRVARGWAPAWSPKGKRLAYARNGLVYVSDRFGNHERRITPTRRIVTDVAWSPDGARIAIAEYTGQISVVDVFGKVQPLVLTTNGLTNASSIDWSPDGRTLALSSGRIGALDLKSHRLRWLTPDDGSNSFEPSWSPDGRKVAFTSDRLDGHQRLFVVNADGSRRHRLEVRGVPPPRHVSQ